ncbi:MAG: flavin reductase domain protein FMN-binding protein [Pelosinus sp.]|jgi:flavin reductase (DIM6/NTAB) family NADH-FMN oxidoreductase RutF|nr:flavin reductase domain protein FMN-binding protein [Pelosinus sp.]
MRREISYNEYATKITELLSKGAFLTTELDGKVNTMTIAWGSIGFMWGKPVFMAMVRPSRFTYEALEKSRQFTVSIPFKDMSTALGICGSKSGRNTDKLTAANLTTNPGQKLSTPVIANCGLHYECKVVYKQEMAPTLLDKGLQDKWYETGDYHTLFFGEILTTYVDED